MLGSSVTRLSRSALQYEIPGIVVDASNGRSWRIRGNGGGTTLWQAYLSHRSQLRPGDWLVVENERGDVTVAENKIYIDQLVADLPEGVCLGWILPHVYYDTQGPSATAQTHQWNVDMTALLRKEVPRVACHALVDWNAVVDDATASTPGLSPLQQAAGAPLLYDGRHPTELGQWVYGATISQALAPRS